MLLQNPQLAYALLQAQVVMRIVDPHTAMVSILSFIYNYITLGDILPLFEVFLNLIENPWSYEKKSRVRKCPE